MKRREFLSTLLCLPAVASVLRKGSVAEEDMYVITGKWTKELKPEFRNRLPIVKSIYTATGDGIYLSTQVGACLVDAPTRHLMIKGT